MEQQRAAPHGQYLNVLRVVTMPTSTVVGTFPNSQTITRHCTEHTSLPGRHVISRALLPPPGLHVTFGRQGNQ